MGDRSLGEMSLRVAIAEDLEMKLDELGERMNTRELADWFVLFDVEAEAGRQETENRERRGE